MAYKAAGILPISMTRRGETVVLLMHEKRKDGLYYIDVGGKIEVKDCNDAWKTAIREWIEETTLFVPPPRSVMHKVFCKKCKYMNFVIYYKYFTPKPTTPYKWVNLEALLTHSTGLAIHPRLTDILENMKNMGFTSEQTLPMW